MKKKSLLVAVIIIATVTVQAQKLKKADKETMANLQAHVTYLADDKLEGRRTGSKGEQLAMDYIKTQFEKYGISPKGTAGYFQAFTVNDGKAIGPDTYFSINDNKLQPEKDYFPFPYSPDKNIEAMPAVVLQEHDMPWFVDLKDVFADNKDNPHFDLEAYIYNNAKKATEKLATAIIVYNSSDRDDQLKFKGKDRSEKLAIPVVYVTKPVADKFFADKTAPLDIHLRTSIVEKTRTGHNVVGYIDNGAANTVILGAHFDHLGYGEDGNSMLRTGEKQIHNGADDNASGTAALIELGRLLKTSKITGNNYLLIAFSGEELGLLGSKYYTNNPTINLSGANYMINMDMVGRLDETQKSISIGGFGTSPQWAQVITNNKKNYFTIVTDSSGTGPSDHTSFYQKQIPVLFYFTGTHADYHKPDDDANKINYTGQVYIVNHILNVITQLNKQPKLSFLPTREKTMRSSGSFKVTLGVMPDYAYTGTGLKIDGVTEGRPAAAAGLKAGDIVLSIGHLAINNMDAYMQALQAFEKGQTVKITFKRGDKTQEASLTF